MADITGTASVPGTVRQGPVRRFLQATELDTRLLGMLGATVVIWIAFHMITAWLTSGNPLNFAAGVFLTPRNFFNITAQSASIAVMAAGMVLIIVTRNIDLSVGSMLGFVGMLIAVTQATILPYFVGFDHPLTWLVAIIVGVTAGALIGALHGSIVAYLGVPSFVVTLGGLLIWRGAAWWVTTGQTVAPLDSRFLLLGGGPKGSLGVTWSWIVAGVACVLIVVALVNGRRQRQRFRFPLRPMWAEVTLAIIYCALVLGAVAVLNAYPWPPLTARQYANQHGIPWPEGGLFIGHGIAIPVLVAVAIAVVMSFIATRTRFGRYVFAIGGNPEAAELGGINTRWVTVKVFMLMGALVGIASAIATARLTSGLNSTGTLDELYTIAAAVIGGTSLSGGVGTIAGAILGALLMQSLQSGMVTIGLEAALQNITVGVVLVVAVLIDSLYRRRKA